MKDYVFVEFLFTMAEANYEMGKLNELGTDYIPISHSFEHEYENDLVVSEYIRLSGKINAETASLIKLQNPALAGKMRISYISDELKDKYRR
jgi:hypothetical protein